MALSAGCHIEIRNGGSDTICSGAFDPTQTAGMWTDGAATSANTASPVFTSASYNFVAGDVGAYLFIGAGTNWTKGWYRIASVNAGAATLTATASGYQPYSDGVNTSAGCASVASPTGATWAVDYSQQAAAEFSGTDGTAAGAGSTLSSATIGFLKHMVGNAVRITAGTNATTGHHVITSVAAGVATFNNAVTTGATADTTIYLGGALASPGYSGGLNIAGNTIWLQYNATPFTITSTTANVTNGRPTFTAGTVAAQCIFQGYETVRGNIPVNRPEIKWGVNAASNYAVTGAAYFHHRHYIINGNRANFTNVQGLNTNGQSTVFNVKVMSCTGVCIAFSGTVTVIGYEQTDCTAAAAHSANHIRWFDCYFHDNTTDAVLLNSNGSGMFSNCVFDTNAGHGISFTTTGQFINIDGCVFYNHTGTKSGISMTIAPSQMFISNCIFVSNSAYGVSAGATNYRGAFLKNCAFFNNTSGATNNILAAQQEGQITLTADPFVDAANGDFRLNMNAGGGALLRGAGYPQTFPGLTWANRRDIGAHQHSGRSPAGVQ